MFQKRVWALIFVFLINAIVDLFIYTFFTAHLLAVSDNNIAFMARFYILEYIAIGAGFVLLLPIVKRLNKAVVLRVGAVLKAVFLLLVVLLGKSIVDHYVWLALLCGFFEAIFWSGGNTLKNKVVESEKIKSLISTININSKIVGIICPVLLGLSIDAWSFTKISIFILGLMSIQIVLSVFIRQPHIKEDKASLKSFYLAVKNSEHKSLITPTFLVIFFRGLQFFLPTFLTYLIICLYGTNTSLGILTTIASVLSIVLLIIFNAIKNADRSVWLYVLFAVLESASLILAVVYMNKLFIVIFQMVSVCVTLITDSMTESIRGSTIKDAKLDKFIPEAMAVGEVFLNAGRVLGFVALMFIGVLNSFLATVLISCLFIIFIFVYFVCLGIVKNKIKRYQEAITQIGTQTEEINKQKQKALD